MAAHGDMTPLDPTRTVRHRNFNRAGTQVWEAGSADGRWSYRRLEDTGTPWIVVDTRTGEELPFWCGSLPKARRATALVDAK